MSNCPKSSSISRTCRLTAHTPRPRASSSGNRSGAAGADATASADSHAPKNISCSRLSCSLLGRHLPQVRHTSIAPMWSNRWICVRSQSETCAGPVSRNADCSAAARDSSALISHAPERWTTRAPSPATVTWTSGSRTGIDDSPSRQASSNAAGTQRHDSKAFAYNRPLAPVAQWIEQPPPKGQVARSIRVRGATRRGPPDALFDLQSCVPDHFFPLGGVGQNDRDQLLGIAAHRLRTLLRQLFLQQRELHHLRETAAEHGDHRFRSASRSEYPEVCIGFVAGKAGLGHGGDVGREPRPLEARDR